MTESILKGLKPPCRPVHGSNFIADSYGHPITVSQIVELINAIPGLEARCERAEGFAEGLRKSLSDTKFPVCDKCNGHGYYLIGSDKIGCEWCHSEGVMVKQLKEEICKLTLQVEKVPVTIVQPNLDKAYHEMETKIAALTAELAAARKERDEVRPTVRRFATEMERVLRRNDHKGGWRGCTHDYLSARLVEEVAELLSALVQNKDEQTVLDESCDVANFSMMIADLFCPNAFNGSDEEVRE